LASTPNFTNGARLTRASLSAANTARDGTGTITSLMAGVSGGTKVNRVTVKHSVTTTAGMIRLFLSLDTGATWALFDEIPVQAFTPSASVPSNRAEMVYTDLELPSAAAVLGCTTHNAEACNVFAHGGDFI
jgi:hypothetical protein